MPAATTGLGILHSPFTIHMFARTAIYLACSYYYVFSVLVLVYMCAHTAYGGRRRHPSPARLEEKRKKALWDALSSVLGVRRRASSIPLAHRPHSQPLPLSSLFFCFYFLFFIFWFFGAQMHSGMLECVMRAPTRFFDTTPIGRILNRFTSDQYTLDNDLRQNVSMVLMCVMRVLQVITIKQ
jgi:hypothetical protein